MANELKTRPIEGQIMNKNRKKALSTLLSVSLLILLVYRAGPQILRNYQLQGQSVPRHETTILHSQVPSQLGQEIPFPSSERSLIIFWATWCAPCKLEMKRISSAVKDGSIDASKVYALNLFENERDIIRFAQKNDFALTYIQKTKAFSELGIQVTPTTLLLDGNKIERASSGASLIGIWWAQFFLADNDQKL